MAVAFVLPSSAHEQDLSQRDKNPYLDVPEISGGVGFLSQQQEKAIGERMLRAVRKQLPVIEDAWLEQEIAGIFGHIYSQTNLGQPLATVIVGDQQINAFAVPGGMFAINAGVITSSKNIDEVAGVIAHEVAHVSQRHYSRSREAMRGQTLLSLLGMMAGVALASQTSDAGAAVMLGSQVALMDKRLTYSRNQEREADRVGMQYMSIAGYNPISMADFFETMHRSTTSVSYLPEFWLTHPLTSERMSESRLRARQFPVAHPTSDQQQSFEMIRWRVAVLSDYADINQLKTLASRNVGAALALATHYIRQSKFTAAKQILDQVKPNSVQEKLYALTWADYYAGQGQSVQALEVILPHYLIAPENKVLALAMANAYRINKQSQKALDILRPLSVKHPTDPKVWQALYQNELIRDYPLKDIYVLMYKAELQFWTGDEEAALITLLHANRLVDRQSNELVKAKVKARLAEMQEARHFKV